jgi:uncharacterized protein involved in exopolysaccharide biosynthesis
MSASPLPEEQRSALLGILLLVTRRIGWFLTPVVTAIAVAVVMYVVGLQHRYAATTIMVPGSRAAGPSGLSGLAAQLGVSVNLGANDEPLAFYQELVRSRELMLAVAESEYVGPNGQASRVIDHLGVELEDDTAQYLLDAVGQLRGRVDVVANLNAGTVTIRTTASDAHLCEYIARRILELINDFNLRKRRHQPAEEMRFTEERLGSARAELEEAERNLQEFLQRNRTWEQSASLQFEHSRLVRRVDLRQSVYIALAQAHEQARIEAVRNTPVFTVLDPPEGSAQRTSSLVAVLAFGLVAGTISGMALAVLVDFWSRQRVLTPTTFDSLPSIIRPVFQKGSGDGAA